MTLFEQAMTPQARKFALAAHVTSSVGWLGAVAGFLALAVAGLTSRDPAIVRSAYLATSVLTWLVIVPLSFASLVTGVVQGLGTPWGIIRHYWVLAKLVLNVLATILLLLHTQPIEQVASAAAQGALAWGDLRPVRVQLVADAGAALLALLAATALSVYKPRGLTPYGRRQHLDEGLPPQPIADDAAPSRVPQSRARRPRWVFVSSVVVVHAALLFIILHLAGGGLGRH